jgi:hypothetical protein
MPRNCKESFEIKIYRLTKWRDSVDIGPCHDMSCILLQLDHSWQPRSTVYYCIPIESLKNVMFRDWTPILNLKIRIPYNNLIVSLSWEKNKMFVGPNLKPNLSPLNLKLTLFSRELCLQKLFPSYIFHVENGKSVQQSVGRELEPSPVIVRPFWVTDFLLLSKSREPLTFFYYWFLSRQSWREWSSSFLIDWLPSE